MVEGSICLCGLTLDVLFRHLSIKWLSLKKRMRHPSEGWRINGQYDETNDPTETAASLSGGNQERQSLFTG
jgi:hypothetical protein